MKNVVLSGIYGQNNEFGGSPEWNPRGQFFQNIFSGVIR